MEEIKKQLTDNGYEWATAFATEDEVKNKSACGQLSIITENLKEWANPWDLID